MNMPHPRGRPRPALAAVLALGIAVAGCQTPGNPFVTQDTSQMTPAERQLYEDEKRFNETVGSAVLLGAAGGAIVGAGLGAAMGNSRDAARGAAIGAVLGGVLLGTDGYQTAQKERQARSEIRDLRAAADSVREDNAQLQRYLDTSSKVLAEGRTRLKQLSRDVAARKLSVEQADAARKREQRNIASMNETLETSRKARDDYVKSAAQLPANPQGKRDFDGEIRRMNAQIEQLEKNVTAYNQALQVSRA